MTNEEALHLKAAQYATETGAQVKERLAFYNPRIVLTPEEERGNWLLRYEAYKDGYKEGERSGKDG